MRDYLIIVTNDIGLEVFNDYVEATNVTNAVIKFLQSNCLALGDNIKVI